MACTISAAAPPPPPVCAAQTQDCVVVSQLGHTITVFRDSSVLRPLASRRDPLTIRSAPTTLQKALEEPVEKL